MTQVANGFSHFLGDIKLAKMIINDIFPKELIANVSN